MSPLSAIFTSSPSLWCSNKSTSLALSATISLRYYKKISYQSACPSSQCPTVAKQEKKKALTGRAKMRQVYNRRFVNVTSQVGDKGKMNPTPTASP
ncbi:hypothetical protein [Absidia glauca]|uniref:Uncharacterized protein n=1 Tax=Absidia glauca TaxID=4829 RepID=A0A168M061_ABSGL|nr:hypothetical protein [Absidia glauca]